VSQVADARIEHHRAIAERAIPLAALLQVALLSLGWGGNSPALRYSLGALPPIGAAGVRFAIALALITLVVLWRRIPVRLVRADWPRLIGMGLLFMVQICLLNLGSAQTTAARQALLINSYPLFVPLLAHAFVPGERLRWQNCLGTGLAFLGVLVLFGEKALRSDGDPTGDLLVTASAVLLAVKAIYTSLLVRTYDPYVVLLVQMGVGVAGFFGLSLLSEPQLYRWTPLVTLSMLYQGIVVAGLCFMGWSALLKHYSPSRLSVGFFMTPVFGAGLSYFFLGERPTAGLALAGLAILAGLFVVNRR